MQYLHYSPPEPGQGRVTDAINSLTRVQIVDLLKSAPNFSLRGIASAQKGVLVTKLTSVVNQILEDWLNYLSHVPKDEQVPLTKEPYKSRYYFIVTFYNAIVLNGPNPTPGFVTSDSPIYGTGARQSNSSAHQSGQTNQMQRAHSTLPVMATSSNRQMNTATNGNIYNNTCDTNGMIATNMNSSSASTSNSFRSDNRSDNNRNVNNNINIGSNNNIMNSNNNINSLNSSETSNAGLLRTLPQTWQQTSNPSSRPLNFAYSPTPSANQLPDIISPSVEPKKRNRITMEATNPSPVQLQTCHQITSGTNIQLSYSEDPFYTVDSRFIEPVCHLLVEPIGNSRSRQIVFQIPAGFVGPNQPRLIARCYELKRKISSLQFDHPTMKHSWPPNCHLQVNRVSVDMTSILRTDKNKIEDSFADLTPFLSPAVSQYTLNISFTSKLTFLLVLQWMKKNSVEDLVQQVVAENTVPIDKALILVKNSFSTDDDMVEVCQKVSFKDPISLARIKTPARSKLCTHIACFDLSNYLGMNERVRTWKCPLCSGPAPFNSLMVDAFFADVETKTTKMSEVEIYPDGTYRADTSAADASASDDDDSIENVILLSDSEDEKDMASEMLVESGNIQAQQTAASTIPFQFNNAQANVNSVSSNSTTLSFVPQRISPFAPEQQNEQIVAEAAPSIQSETAPTNISSTIGPDTTVPPNIPLSSSSNNAPSPNIQNVAPIGPSDLQAPLSHSNASNIPHLPVFPPTTPTSTSDMRDVAQSPSSNHNTPNGSNNAGNTLSTVSSSYQTPLSPVSPTQNLGPQSQYVYHQPVVATGYTLNHRNNVYPVYHVPRTQMQSLPDPYSNYNVGVASAGMPTYSSFPINNSQTMASNASHYTVTVPIANPTPLAATHSSQSISPSRAMINLPVAASPILSNSSPRSPPLTMPANSPRSAPTPVSPVPTSVSSANFPAPSNPPVPSTSTTVPASPTAVASPVNPVAPNIPSVGSRFAPVNPPIASRTTPANVPIASRTTPINTPANAPVSSTSTPVNPPALSNPPMASASTQAVNPPIASTVAPINSSASINPPVASNTTPVNPPVTSRAIPTNQTASTNAPVASTPKIVNSPPSTIARAHFANFIKSSAWGATNRGLSADLPIDLDSDEE